MVTPRDMSEITLTLKNPYSIHTISHFLDGYKWSIYLQLSLTHVHAKIVQIRKQKNNLWFFKPIQFPVHGQWWSSLITHLPQTLQWCVLGGFILLHLSHHLNAKCPLFFGCTSTTYFLTPSSSYNNPVSISLLCSSIFPFFYFLSAFFSDLISIISYKDLVAFLL